MLTPEGVWNFSHPRPSQGPRLAKVMASALNPPCLSWISYIYRARGWGWLRQAQLIEALWPQLTPGSRADSEDLLSRLEASSYMRKMILVSQQPAQAAPFLFQLMLTSLRHLQKGGSAKRILSLFSIKLLLHEGLWPQPLQCLQCARDIESAMLIALPQGFFCSDCARGAGAKRVEFESFEVLLLTTIGCLRDWRALGELPLENSTGEKIRAATEMILEQS